MEKYIWSEKYAPQKLSGCILPKKTEEMFKNAIKANELPIYLFHGKPGTGKTTMAHVLCNELNLLPLFINGSKDSGIDVLRNNIESFVTARSIEGKKKIVVIDEADYMNPQSLQPSLRGFLDKFQSKCSFLFTCNYPQKIIEPLQSRCTVIDFTIPTAEKKEVLKKCIVRTLKILSTENVKHDKKTVIELCSKYFPDFRKILIELQKSYVSLGEIPNDLVEDIESNLKDLFQQMKMKHYTNVRKFSMNADSSSIYTQLYNELFTVLKPEDIPASIITLADYQYKNAFVADKELNLLACLSEIMFNAEFI